MSRVNAFEQWCVDIASVREDGVNRPGRSGSGSAASAADVSTEHDDHRHTVFP